MKKLCSVPIALPFGTVGCEIFTALRNIVGNDKNDISSAFNARITKHQNLKDHLIRAKVNKSSNQINIDVEMSNLPPLNNMH